MDTSTSRNVHGILRSSTVLNASTFADTPTTTPRPIVTLAQTWLSLTLSSNGRTIRILLEQIKAAMKTVEDKKGALQPIRL